MGWRSRYMGTLPEVGQVQEADRVRHRVGHPVDMRQHEVCRLDQRCACRDKAHELEQMPELEKILV